MIKKKKKDIYFVTKSLITFNMYGIIKAFKMTHYNINNTNNKH